MHFYLNNVNENLTVAVNFTAHLTVSTYVIVTIGFINRCGFR